MFILCVWLCNRVNGFKKRTEKWVDGKTWGNDRTTRYWCAEQKNANPVEGREQERLEQITVEWYLKDFIGENKNNRKVDKEENKWTEKEDRGTDFIK